MFIPGGQSILNGFFLDDVSKIINDPALVYSRHSPFVGGPQPLYPPTVPASFALATSQNI